MKDSDKAATKLDYPKKKKDAPLNGIAKAKYSIGLRKSNLSRSKGHHYEFIKAVAVGVDRKIIVYFRDKMEGNKVMTRVGFYTAKGADIEYIKLVSLEGFEDVKLEAENMVKGRILKVSDRGARLERV